MGRAATDKQCLVCHDSAADAGIELAFVHPMRAE
jgi:hypothetical protein